MTATPDPATAPAPEATLLPLTGFTVAVTAARRADELATLLERRGAAVLATPAIRIVPLPDDHELLRATRACLAEPPDVIVVTTGIGFRGWMMDGGSRRLGARRPAAGHAGRR